jgi:Major Facilitator Superfamily
VREADPLRTPGSDSDGDTHDCDQKEAEQRERPDLSPQLPRNGIELRIDSVQVLLEGVRRRTDHRLMMIGPDPDVNGEKTGGRHTIPQAHLPHENPLGRELDRQEGPSAREYERRWWTLGVLCISLVMIVMANASLNVALPTLARDLHAESSSLQWIVDAYSLVFAGLLLTAGSLGDRYGRRLALNGGLIIFGTASFAAVLSSSSTAVIASRALMGVGAAFVMPVRGPRHQHLREGHGARRCLRARCVAHHLSRELHRAHQPFDRPTRGQPVRRGSRTLRWSPPHRDTKRTNSSTGSTTSVPTTTPPVGLAPPRRPR